MKFERVFCFGDSITLGYNDSQGLGWPGRLCRGLLHGNYYVAAYNLGVNGDTSLDIENRWQVEAAAQKVSHVLWIGPTPLDETINPMQTEYESWDMRNADIARYDDAYAGVARELGIDYLQLFAEFSSSPRYQAALLAGDRVHPGDDGYALIAERIATWDKWLEIL